VSGLPSISEAEFTTQVVKLAQLYGWCVCHIRPAKTGRGWRTAIQGDPGLPDIIAARGGIVVGAELKVGKGKATPAQIRWLKEWGLNGYLWWPRDWDQIEDVFSGRR